jgi:uncharacterized protein YbjT (DUF2867 family)
MTAIPLETLVTVFGGSGFLGRHVVRALAKLGYRIRVAVRRPELAGFLQPLGRVGQIHAVQANLRYPASVEAAARGADVVVNLVGILFERGPQRFDAVQAVGAEAVARAAAAAGARMVHVSAIAADEQSPRTCPLQGPGREAGVRCRAVGCHPAASVVFGPEDDFFNKFAAIARLRPRCRWSAEATLFQRLRWRRRKRRRRRDRDRAKEGQIYELGGPEAHSFKELMHHARDHRPPAPLAADPFGLAAAGAFSHACHCDDRSGRPAARDYRPRRPARRPHAEALGIDPIAMATIVPHLWRFARAASSGNVIDNQYRFDARPRTTDDRPLTTPCPSSPISRFAPDRAKKHPARDLRLRRARVLRRAQLNANRAELDAIRLRQRVLIDVSKVALATSMLGETVSMPLAIAPTGLTGLVHGDGEMLAARAAEAAGVKFCLSTMSICSIEDVRSVVKAPFWFQLYMFRDRGFSRSVIERARAANCSALFVTVDLPMRGQRHADIKNGLTVPPRLTARNAFDIATKPAWLASVLLGRRKTFGNVEAYLKGRVGIEKAGAWSNQNFDRSLNWRDIEWVRPMAGQAGAQGHPRIETLRPPRRRGRRHRGLQPWRPAARRRAFHHQSLA